MVKNLHPGLVRPDVEALLSAVRLSPPIETSDIDPNSLRLAVADMTQMVEADTVDLATIRELRCPGAAGDIRLRLYDSREEREGSAVIVYFHGGGFVVGDLETHHSLCTAIASQADLPVVAVDYRLAPEHPFPAGFHDCLAAAQWLAASPPALGFKTTALITAGDSAGGNLAICVAQDLAANPAKVPVIMQVPLYPMIDASEHGSMSEFGEGYVLTKELIQWYLQCYQPVADDSRAFPLMGDLAATPATILVTAGLDPLRDQGRRYAAALITAGVDCHFMEMRGTIHGFANLRKALPSAQDDLNRIVKAVATYVTCQMATLKKAQ